MHLENSFNSQSFPDIVVTVKFAECQARLSKRNHVYTTCGCLHLSDINLIKQPAIFDNLNFCSNKAEFIAAPIFQRN